MCLCEVSLNNGNVYSFFSVLLAASLSKSEVVYHTLLSTSLSTSRILDTKYTEISISQVSAAALLKDLE